VNYYVKFGKRENFIMSNIGKQSISIPEGVNIEISGQNVSVKGKLGELNLIYDSRIKVVNSDNAIIVTRSSDKKEFRELHGLYRALINNMVIGVTEGYSKELHLVGVGYTAEKKGEFVLINAGYSHAIYFEIPDGIDIDLPNNTTIVIKGINKQNVGDVAAKIRQIRKPEPYKGKGIKYSDEIIRRKAGKTVGAGAA